MRKVQITIKMDMFGDMAPITGHQDTLTVYADANNYSEAIVAAFQTLTNELDKKTKIHSFGVTDHNIKSNKPK